MIPQTFEEWKNCIVKDCSINLTAEFAKARLKIYEDRDNRETKKFMSLYGEAHLENLIRWFKMVL
jgi:hypothetical protein